MKNWLDVTQCIFVFWKLSTRDGHNRRQPMITLLDTAPALFSAWYAIICRELHNTVLSVRAFETKTGPGGRGMDSYTTYLSHSKHGFRFDASRVAFYASPLKPTMTTPGSRLGSPSPPPPSPGSSLTPPPTASRNQRKKKNEKVDENRNRTFSYPPHQNGTANIYHIISYDVHDTAVTSQNTPYCAALRCVARSRAKTEARA